jgi:type II secretory ATPase GspE/PulE/Tfp pilus assembly ATPase PilB-like protein
VSDVDKEYLNAKIVDIQRVTGKTYTVPAELPLAVGCEKCNHTGYLGRIVIAEIFRVDEVFKEMIIKNATAIELKAKAESLGLINMQQDGIIKVLAGKTALEEVKRVTN